MPSFDLNSPEFMKRAGNSYPYEVPEINTEKASIARVYSYYLGGKDHFEADRDMANYAESVVPGVTDLALGNRAFVQRATRYLAAERGIKQFLDIGSGLPTDGNVHEVAHESVPDARVVYVDNDAIVLAHARALLADNNTTVVLCNDLTRPAEVLAEAQGTGLIDLSRPLGVMLGGILHHLGDAEDPAGIARQLREAVAPGSCLVVSHFCEPDAAEMPDEAHRAQRLQAAFLERLKTGMWRTTEQIHEYFGDWNLVEPGVAPLNKWRPLPPDAKSVGSYMMPPRNENLIVGGVAVKP